MQTFKEMLNAWIGIVAMGLIGAKDSWRWVRDGSPGYLLGVLVWMTWSLFWLVAFPFFAPFIYFFQK